MSQFLELNISENSLIEPGFVKILPTSDPIESNVCVCCLDLSGPFVKLRTCVHSQFVRNICCELPDLETMVACRLCHSMLSKIDIFKKQVEKSLRTLGVQAEHVNKSNPELQPNRNINNLQHSTKQPFIILNNNNIDIKIEQTDVLSTKHLMEETSLNEILYERIIYPSESSSNLKKESKTRSNSKDRLADTFVDLKDETLIKIETDFDYEDMDSDLETIPLSEVKKEIRAKRSAKDVEIKVKTGKTKLKDARQQQSYLASHTKSTQIEEKYKGKIREVILTHDEVISERQSELAKLKLPYQCLDCVKGFEFEANLDEHMQKLHNFKENSFQCEICNSCFAKDLLNKMHYLRHFTRYECAKCLKRYNTLNAVLAHYNSSHSESGDVISTVQTCKHCNISFVNNRAYRYHLSKHKGKVPCGECNKSFVNKSGLKKHMLLVHKDASRGYKCEPCDKTYKTKEGLKTHIKTHHNDDTAYCDTCQTYFKSESNLKMHLKTHSRHISDDDKKFVCSECGERFLHQRYLTQHVNYSHLRNSQFHCQLCDKAFKTNSSLKTHKRFVHDKETPPKNKICDHCGRGFATTATLTCHMRRHTGERPLKCGFCDASFAHSGALYTHKKLHLQKLQIHMRTHTGERPLLCDRCDSTFRQPAALYRHKLLVHRLKSQISPS